MLSLTDYELRHLAEHLERSGRHDELHRLLNFNQKTQLGTLSDKSRERNFWYDVKDSLGDLAGYRADVTRAWKSLKEQKYSVGSRSGNVNLEIRYALIIASLNSRVTNVTPALLEAMIREKIWTPEKCLETASRILEPERRAEALTRVAPYLPSHLFQRALTVAYQIPPDADRAFALVFLATSRPERKQELQTQALGIIRRISDEDERAKAFARIAVQLLPPLDRPVQQALLNVWRTLKSDWSRLQALPTIVAFLTSPARQAALRHALSYITKWCPEQVENLIPCISDDLLRSSIRAIRRIENNYYRIEALRQLTTRFPRVAQWSGFRSELKMILEMAHPWDRLELLFKLYPFLSDDLKQKIVSEALVTTATEPSPSGGTAGFPQWAERLGDLVKQLTGLEKQQVLQHALTVAHTLDHGGLSAARHNAMAYLIPMLSEVSPLDALKEIEWLEYDSAKAQAFVKIAPKLPQAARTEVLRHALTEARKIDAEFHGMYIVLERLADVFVSVASQVDPPLKSEILLEAADIVSEIHDHWYDAKLLVDFAANLAGEERQQLLQIAFQAAQLAEDPSRRARVLIKLIPMLTGRLRRTAYRQAVMTARQMKPDYRKAQIITTLAIQAGVKTQRKKLQEALAVSREVVNVEERVRIQLQLIQHLPESLLTEALPVTREKPDYAAVEVLTALLRRLPDNVIPEALEIADGYTPYWARGVALSAVAARLPDGWQRELLLNKAVHLASTTNATESDVMVLIAVAKQLSGRHRTRLLKQAIRLELAYLSESMYDEDSHVDSKLLISLIPSLDTNLRNELLAQLREILYEVLRFEVIIALIPYLPQSSLPAVLSHVEATKYDEWFLAQILIALLPNASRELVRAIALKAREIEDVNAKGLVLSSLVLYVAGNKRREFIKRSLSVIRRVTDDAGRANSFIRVLPYLVGRERDDAILSVLDAMSTIQNTEERNKVLAGIVPHWKQLRPELLLESWSRILSQLANNSRSDLLVALPHLRDLIAVIGGDASLEGVARSVERVGSWWP